MLSKTKKFTTTDFSLIKNQKPKKTYTEIGVFCLYPTPFLAKIGPKFTIVPTKKIFKTAVLRNKHKRLFYNCLREILGSGFLDLKMSVIFYPNKIFTKDQLKTALEKIVL